MDPVAVRAAAVLARSPSPALRLSTLLELLGREEPPARMDAGALRRILERYPQTFRFLDPWRGPWCPTRDRTPSDPTSVEAWVMTVEDPGSGDLPAAGLPKLRESVRWLARAVDMRSSVQVARTHGFVLAEGEARAALKRAA